VYTWTDEKNKANKEKHGFYLSDIVDVFDDPHLIDWYDAAHSSFDEDRYICLGCFHDVVILFVVFTQTGDDIHLITARKAEPHEEALYYEYYRKNTDSSGN
jgi:uncharacterized DUF497 family protein